jgi:rod shape-determining protein MreB
MDQVIEDHFRQKHHFAIGEATAEKIKIRYGSVSAEGLDSEFEVKGLNTRTGRPSTLIANTAEIRDAIETVAAGTVEALRNCIEALPPELSGDMLESRVALVGGVALLRGWQERLTKEFGLSSRVIPDPTLSVIRGLLRVLEDRTLYRNLVDNSAYQPALAG